MCLIDKHVSKLSNQSFVQTDIHAFSNSEFRLQKYHIYASTIQTKHLILYYMKDSVINYTCTHVYTFQVQRSSTVQHSYIHTHKWTQTMFETIIMCIAFSRYRLESDATTSLGRLGATVTLAARLLKHIHLYKTTKSFPPHFLNTAV